MEHEKEVVISKLLPAARETVWRAWLEPAMITRWWGPDGTTVPECEVNPTVGGHMHLVMLAGPGLGPLAGQRWPMEGQIVEMTPPEHLVFNNNALGEAGDILLSGTTSVELKDEAAGTLMTVVARARGEGEVAAQMLAGMETGWQQQIDKLAAFLSAPLA